MGEIQDIKITYKDGTEKTITRNEVARYIDAEVLKRKLIDEKNFFPAIVARTLEQMPTADVVEVVRCKECKWWIDEIDCRNESGLYRFVPNGNWFCASGKRRDT